MTVHSRVSSFFSGTEEVAALRDSFWLLSGSMVIFLPVSFQAPMPYDRLLSIWNWWFLTSAVAPLLNKGAGRRTKKGKTRRLYTGTALLNYSRTLMEMNHFNSLIDNEMNNKQQRVT